MLVRNCGFADLRTNLRTYTAVVQCRWTVSHPQSSSKQLLITWARFESASPKFQLFLNGFNSIPQKSTEYRGKRAKKVTTVTKMVLFWKSTDVTDNGTNKVLRY